MESAVYKALDVISEANRYNAWLFNAIKKDISGHVLDVGSGLGNIIAFYNDCPVKDVYATDPYDDMIEALTKRFATVPNYKIIKLDILSKASKDFIPKNHIDTVTCVNVLEHIDNDLAALIGMREILKPNGKILLIVPAFQCLLGSLDVMAGHYRRYAKKSMAQLTEAAGLILERQFYINMFGTVSWYLAGKVFKHKEFKAGSCRQLDRLVPFLEGLEKVIPPPFGQSLVVICRKK